MDHEALTNGAVHHEFPIDKKQDSLKKSRDETFHRRQRMIGPSCELLYSDDPLKIVRGSKQYLFDEDGTKYLDCVNNVSHVGHCHPEVVKACHKQMEILNTNSRYLHDGIVNYAERLLATFPEELSVCYFVNSGSEANDLALQLARWHTGHYDVAVIDRAYHGHTSTLMEISPYKHKKFGPDYKLPSYIHVTPCPDVYRGMHTGSVEDPALGEKYAREVKEVIELAHKKGRKIAAFFAESFQGCGGQVIYPANFLKAASRYVHQGGGLLIADEIQVGFGRAGNYFWAFESQDVVPDIVTIGKPIGNGHPMSAVITTKAIAESFRKSNVVYFATFGGNPVSMAIGNAVLDIIENENLQQHAKELGEYIIAKMKDLQTRHPLIGDVRGMGLFLGVELVKDRTTKEPATQIVKKIVYRFKEHGVIMTSDGEHNNVLKLKPPLCFSKDNADFLLDTLDKLLSEFEDHSVIMDN